MDNERFVSFVDQEVEPHMAITFSFKAKGKCCRMDVDMDVVRAFISLLKDLKAVSSQTLSAFR
jgi:hypothetical protein